ncbi:unnamed protein product, partial [Lymnaea stagnalis]
MADWQDNLDSLTEGAVSIVDVINKDFLCCAKCNGQFDKVDKVPITLSCLHSFCRPCLKKTVAPNHKLNCPVCRKTQTIEGDIDALPADFRIMKMIDLISNKIKHTCLQHKSQRLNFFCTNCKTPICHDCTVLKHPKGQNHAIIEISDAFKNYTPKFDNLERFSDRMVNAMKVKRKNYIDELKELERMHRVLKGNISEKFEYYRMVLKQRETDITQKADRVVEEQRKEIEHACQVIEQEMKSLNILQEQFKIVRLNKDTRLVFKEYHEFQDLESFFDYLVQPEPEAFFKKYIFTHTNEEPLLDLLKEAGDV